VDTTRIGGCVTPIGLYAALSLGNGYQADKASGSQFVRLLARHFGAVLAAAFGRTTPRRQGAGKFGVRGILQGGGCESAPAACCAVCVSRPKKRRLENH